MADYINREELLNRLDERWDFLQKQYGNHDQYVKGYDDCVDDVENFPVTDLVLAFERKRGEWVGDLISVRGIVWRHKCSECGRASDYKHNFCPNCGADMRGEKHEP